MNPIAGKKILITGGAGFLGRALARRFLPMGPKEIVIASRDEVKHAEMRKTYPDLTYMVADVRDERRMRRAAYGVDILIHAAAMKRVESCTFDPQEAVKTNIHGSQNVVEAALDNDVPIVIGISSDKACNPVNLYGSTKAAMEHLFLSANVYNLYGKPRFSVARYGNILGSTGSIVPLFLKQKATGVLTVTDERMTRFILTVEDAVNLILSAIEAEAPGLVLPLGAPAMRVMDIAKTIAPEAEIKIIGARPEEKLAEVMYENTDGSFYSSDKPDRWFQPEELRAWMDGEYPGWSPTRVLAQWDAGRS